MLIVGLVLVLSKNLACGMGGGSIWIGPSRLVSMVSGTETFAVITVEEKVSFFNGTGGASNSSVWIQKFLVGFFLDRT